MKKNNKDQDRVLTKTGREIPEVEYVESKVGNAIFYLAAAIIASGSLAALLVMLRWVSREFQ